MPRLSASTLFLFMAAWNAQALDVYGARINQEMRAVMNDALKRFDYSAYAIESIQHVKNPESYVVKTSEPCTYIFTVIRTALDIEAVPNPALQNKTCP